MINITLRTMKRVKSDFAVPTVRRRLRFITAIGTPRLAPSEQQSREYRTYERHEKLFICPAVNQKNESVVGEMVTCAAVKFIVVAVLIFDSAFGLTCNEDPLTINQGDHVTAFVGDEEWQGQNDVGTQIRHVKLCG